MDLDDLQVSESELHEFAEYVGCSYVLTSAWQNRGIDVQYKLTKDAFKILVKGLAKNIKPVDKTDKGSVKTSKTMPSIKPGDRLSTKTEEQNTKQGKNKKCC